MSEKPRNFQVFPLALNKFSSRCFFCKDFFGTSNLRACEWGINQKVFFVVVKKRNFSFE